MALSSVATVKGGETLERSMTVLFSVKFSAYHSPNFFFPDSQPANKQYWLFIFIVSGTHTGIHGRVLLCFRAVL